MIAEYYHVCIICMSLESLAMSPTGLDLNMDINDIYFAMSYS